MTRNFFSEKDKVLVVNKNNIRYKRKGVVLKVYKGTGTVRVLFYGDYKEWFDIADIRLLEAYTEPLIDPLMICLDKDTERLEGEITASNGKTYEFSFKCIK